MLEDYRWLLYASRLYGCHPHTIRERLSSPVYFRPLMLYSLVACALYCAAAYRADGVISCASVKAMIVGCALQRIERFTRGWYMILTTLLSCLRHVEFERAVIVVRKFDDQTWHRVRNDGDHHDGRRAIRRVQWLVLIAIHVAWILFGLLARFATAGKVADITFILQTTTRAAISVEIAKFYFLYDALRRRFRRLDELCRRPTGTTVGANIGVSRKNAARLTISDLHRLHQCLTEATNHLNSYYSLQLFCWMTFMLLDIITYTFLVVYKTTHVWLRITQCFFVIYLTIQVIVLSHICHLTCDQANAFARTVFATEYDTPVFEQTEFSSEVIELGIHLLVHPLRVKVFGLFDLDNRFTFAAFGVLLMYVVLASSIR